MNPPMPPQLVTRPFAHESICTKEREGVVRFVSRGRSRTYTRPLEVVEAGVAVDVLPALERVRQRVQTGYHAAGFLAYEAAAAFDPAFCVHPRVSAPLLWFGIYDGVTDAADEIPEDASTPPLEWRSLVSREDYEVSVARIRELIAAGDTYQVNYTYPLHARFDGDAESLFAALIRAQPADHCAYVDTGRWKILSASPELFFRLRGDELTAQPMKGTAQRGLSFEEDEALGRSLADSAKERAENVMIVDLLRNDMGRISIPGTVDVERLFQVERFDTLWQMTSTIRSRTNADVPEILRAMFPSGSVTGAPKIRTMEIIRELEPYPRGAYCGTVGWWAPDRTAEFNVAIRTCTVDSLDGTAQYHVGSGITWDSSATGEHRECNLKASVLHARRPRFELLESILWDDGYVLLDRHLDRLRNSAAYFGWTIDDGGIRSRLAAQVREFGAAGPRKVRLLARADGGVRLEHVPVQEGTIRRVCWAREPIRREDVFLYHKTTHRQIYESAKDARPDVDDVLLWNEDGEATESTIANLVIERDRDFWTPPIQCGLLPGVFRGHLLETGRIRECVLRKEDVTRADAVYLINSVRKWMRVELVE